MRARIFPGFIILAALITASGCGTPSAKPTMSQKVSLVSGPDRITYIELVNTHSRIYEDQSSGIRLTAPEKEEGVFWKILCVGIKTEEPFEKIILKNEKGVVFTAVRDFLQTSDNSKRFDDRGSVIYEGPTTAFFLLGPDDSRSVQIMLGKASVTFRVPK